MGLCPDKPIRSWKYHKLKMHLIHLTYQAPQLSLAYLKHAQNTCISLQLGKIIYHKAYFIMKCWLSHNLLNTVLKVRNRMVVWVPVVDPHDHVAAWELWLQQLPSIKREDLRASLVAQWLRICLPMQGTRVRALVWEDPTCRGAAGPVSHSCWACASGACAPWQERPRWWEACAPRWGVAPTCRS